MSTTSTAPRFTIYQLLPEFGRDAYFKTFPLTAYTLIAVVAADVLEQVFELCNHGVPGRSDNWTDNPEVIERFVVIAHVRSLSVGDVVSDELGDFYRVAPVGWTKLHAAWFTNPDSTPQSAVRES